MDLSNPSSYGGTTAYSANIGTANLTVAATAVNNPPLGKANTVTTLEGSAYTFKLADFGVHRSQQHARQYSVFRGNHDITIAWHTARQWRPGGRRSPHISRGRYQSQQVEVYLASQRQWLELCQFHVPGARQRRYRQSWRRHRSDTAQADSERHAVNNAPNSPNGWLADSEISHGFERPKHLATPIALCNSTCTRSFSNSFGRWEMDWKFFFQKNSPRLTALATHAGF